jgi:antitoxin (DNA-binding transcriptional repressor) of toxin-antitoxin stability system
MSRATVAEVQHNLSEYLRQAQRRPVEIEENGVVVARLVSGYDPDDEILMAWLSLPEVKARFVASRERAVRGETMSREEALRELGITEEELAAERDRLRTERHEA